MLVLCDFMCLNNKYVPCKPLKPLDERMMKGAENDSENTQKAVFVTYVVIQRNTVMRNLKSLRNTFQKYIEKWSE